MALESGTYIDSLNASNPVATDGLAQADDHMRLIKSTILASFPGITGAVNATHTEINTVADGDTSATSTTLVDADRVPVNDNGTMVQVALSDFKTYMNSNITTINGLTYPTADGNSGEFMTTDGSGTLSFASVVSFLSGMIMPYAGTTAPSGWLFCYGQDVSRTTYADLFTAIGTTYGTGDGSSTFTLPDLRGRTIAGQDDMGGASADRLTNQSGGLDGDTLGATGGAETHTLTEAQLASHKHFGFAETTIDIDGPPGNLTNSTQVAEANNSFGGGDEKYAMGSTGTAATVGLTSATGSGTAHNNVQPTIILNYMIKT